MTQALIDYFSVIWITWTKPKIKDHYSVLVALEYDAEQNVNKLSKINYKYLTELCEKVESPAFNNIIDIEVALIN